MAERVLTRNFDRPDSHTLGAYRAAGGYAAFRKALEMGPEAVAAEVKKSNLRGLGGAGFPTGTKWGFVPKQRSGPVYLVVNADEGEPGTFKDKQLMEQTPFLLVEGMTIAGVAVGATKAAVRRHVKPMAIHRPAPGTAGHVVVEAAPDDADLSD